MEKNNRLKVGDLVRHIRNEVVGVISQVRWVEEEALMLIAPLQPDEIVYIVQWNDEMYSSGGHWAKELEALNVNTK